MAVDGGHGGIGCDWDGRWNHVKKFLERTGPFTHPDFEPSTEVTHDEPGALTLTNLYARRIAAYCFLQSEYSFVHRMLLFVFI